MKRYIQRKENFHNFVNEVKAGYDSIAPVSGKKNKQISASFFAKVNGPREIYLDKKTYYPVKGFFFILKKQSLHPRK